MGLEFLKRVQTTTAVVGVLAFLFVSVYHDLNFGLGILIGCAWGIGNFWALSRVLTAVLTPDTINRRRAYIFAAIKFPVLYGAGYLILRSEWVPPISLIVGFSLLFLVVLLKGLGRAFLHLDDRSPAHPRTGGAR
ncbi:MAG: ATP synthase subunit I [Candidatus Zixiibacteriota bacterium]